MKQRSSSQTNKKRLKVLLIDSEGLSDYTSYLARGLSKYHDIILYGFSEESYITTGAARQETIKFHCIKKKLPKGYSTLRGIATVFILYSILLDVLLRTDYDIVHVQEHLPTFFLFLPLLRLKRKRICWTLHDVELFAPTAGILGKIRVLFSNTVTQPGLMCRYVDRIIVHATSLRDQMIAKGVDKNKLFVISHFDYGYLLEQNADSIPKKSNSRLGQDYALFLGNIAPWKGIDSLIEAAKIVRKELGQRFSLVIAGRPYDGYKELDFFGSLSEDDHRYVTVLNKYMTSTEIPDLISASAFIVLPYNDSFQHSASGVITLAYTFSKPVIVSNIPSLTEYVENGKTGLIFETNNSRRLAEHITNLVTNSSECIEMGKRASRKVFEEMSLERCTQALGSLYTLAPERQSSF